MATPQDTIIIADNDQVTVKTLEAFFKAQDFKVVRFKDRDALANAGDCGGSPCVLILGDVGGVGFLRDWKASGSEIPVIFLHSGSSISEAVSAIRAGADDYITKPFCQQTLLQSVKHSMEKARYRLQVAKTNQDLLRRVAALTQRECEIINLVLAGMLNKQIAEELHIALVTVKFHRGSAMKKLGARTAGELARLAREAGLAPTSKNSHAAASSKNASPKSSANPPAPN